MFCNACSIPSHAEPPHAYVSVAQCSILHEISTGKLGIEKGAILSYIIDAVLNYNSTVLSQFQLLLRPKIIFEKLTWYNSEEKISKVENCFLGNLLTSIEKRISTKTKPPSFR